MTDTSSESTDPEVANPLSLILGLISGLVGPEELREQVFHHVLVDHFFGDHDPHSEEIDMVFGRAEDAYEFLAALLTHEDDKFFAEILAAGVAPTPITTVNLCIFKGRFPEAEVSPVPPHAKAHTHERTLSKWLDLCEENAEVDDISQTNLALVLAMYRYWLNSRRGMEEALKRARIQDTEAATEMLDNARRYGVPAWARKGAVR